MIALSLVPLLPTTVADGDGETPPPAAVTITRPGRSPASVGGVLVDGIVIRPTSISVEWKCPPPATGAQLNFDVKQVDALGNTIGDGGMATGSAHRGPQGQESFTWAPPQSGFYVIEVTLKCVKVVCDPEGGHKVVTTETVKDSRKVYVSK